MTPPPPPRLYLDITETMMPAMEQLAEMVAEKVIVQYIEANPAGSTPAPKLLTRQEAAEELGITIATLDRWRRLGYIESVNIGPGVYISSTEITKHIKSSK